MKCEPSDIVRVGVTGRALRSFHLARYSHCRSERPADVHPLLWKAQRDAIESEIEVLTKEFGELVEICLWGF